MLISHIDTIALLAINFYIFFNNCSQAFENLLTVDGVKRYTKSLAGYILMSVVSLPNIAAPFSAFRSIPSRATDDSLDKDRLVPIDATLIPNDLMQAFAIPLLSFDQREAPVTGAVLQPPFELPLAFSVRLQDIDI